MSAATLAQPESDAHTTTISQPGKTTTISTDENGVTTIRENGKVTTVIDPEAIARKAAEAVTSTGVPATPFPLGHRDFVDEVPESVLRFAVVVLGIIALTIIGFPISRAFARRMDRKTAAPPSDPDIARRLDRIEQAIETMAVEVERVSEAQRYSARLLTERLPDTPARTIAGADHMMR